MSKIETTSQLSSEGETRARAELSTQSGKSGKGYPQVKKDP